MENKKYWDDLFEKINSISNEEFQSLVDQLDGSDDIPFAIVESEEEFIEIIDADENMFNFDDETEGVYKKKSRYKFSKNMNKFNDFDGRAA